ncbi:MAG: hypothetical protein OXH15_07245 [Gammaproteobacteria bacterium]|nr:hypothetical protein [Gammaproteobacteria bacterium]
MSDNTEQTSRDRQRLRRTVFADTDGTGEALAGILGGAEVAETLEAAIESASEVLVLSLDERRQLALSPAQIERLRARKLLVTGHDADIVCRELDLDIGGGMLSGVVAVNVLDPALRLAGDPAAEPIEPLTERPAPRSFELRQDRRHLAWRHVPDELRLADDKGFIEVLVALPQKDSWGVVTRQSNCVFAGVIAPPDDWSPDYRRLFRAVADALAEREHEEFRLAVVPRQVHPPGTVHFELERSKPWTEDNRNNHRMFYFSFDRPTVLTATLRHSGSDAAMLLFHCGTKQRLFTREDDEHGETLTIAVTVSQSSIDAIGGRYWTLDVTNFDHVNGMSAELTVRHDALDGGAIQPMPSDASFEYFHWFAERLETNDASARRQETARSFGFDDWQTLAGHVAWSEAKPPEDGARMRDIYFAQAQAKHGECFGLAELTAFNAPLLEVQDDLRRAIEEAFAIAETRGDAAVGVEHLLIPLLDDPAAEDALTKCGADLVALRRGLLASLESVPQGDAPATSRELFGVLGRSDLYRALGHEGANAASVLVGMFAESCQAKVLLEGQGLRRQDVIRYLAHGIPKLPPARAHTAGVLVAALEGVLHAAFSRAAAEHHEAFGVEHLLLGVTSLFTTDQVESGADLERLRAELETFVATTPRATGDPTPTRALSRVMQQAVARARRKGDAPVDVESLLRAIATETKTFAADVVCRYGVISG